LDTWISSFSPEGRIGWLAIFRVRRVGVAVHEIVNHPDLIAHPNASTVRARKYSLMQVTPSDCSMENFRNREIGRLGAHERDIGAMQRGDERKLARFGGHLPRQQGGSASVQLESVVHVQLPGDPHSISALLARQMTAKSRKLPFITTLHGTDITLVGAEPSYFPITKFSIEQSDGVTCISEYLRARTVEAFGVSNEIRVIHNFVNCDTYTPDPEKSQASRYAPSGEKLLIHVSNFRPVKRVLDCIRILAEARQQVPAHLLMVGDGPESSPAERLARDLGVDRHVTFLGKQNHVERLLRQAHVLLMPSELEGFGLAALEAMACGVPAVATNVGGVRSW